MWPDKGWPLIDMDIYKGGGGYFLIHTYYCNRYNHFFILQVLIDKWYGDTIGIENVVFFGIIYVSLSSKAIKSNSQNQCISPLRPTLTIFQLYCGVWLIKMTYLTKSADNYRIQKIFLCSSVKRKEHINLWYSCATILWTYSNI